MVGAWFRITVLLLLPLLLIVLPITLCITSWQVDEVSLNNRLLSC